MEMYVYLASIILAYMTLLFGIAQIKQDNSVVDVGWGIGFIIIALTTFAYIPNPSLLQIMITLCICIWGTRLSTHIFLRNWVKGEDPRYTAMKKNWGAWAPLYSYLQVFILQGSLMLPISYPVILINSTPNAPLTWIALIGLGMWLVGFFFEIVGDYQLTLFLQKPENKGRIMRYGIWQYTRHPNYFGELMMWWGIFLMALPLPGGIFTIISPFIMTFLLLYVSGIPLIEKSFESNKEFQEYKKTTNALIPWFPKKG